MSKRPKHLWTITIGDTVSLIEARTPGAVFRQAVRRLIRTGKLTHQPPPDERGWYKGVSLPMLHKPQ